MPKVMQSIGMRLFNAFLRLATGIRGHTGPGQAEDEAIVPTNAARVTIEAVQRVKRVYEERLRNASSTITSSSRRTSHRPPLHLPSALFPLFTLPRSIPQPLALACSPPLLPPPPSQCWTLKGKTKKMKKKRNGRSLRLPLSSLLTLPPLLVLDSFGSPHHKCHFLHRPHCFCHFLPTSFCTPLLGPP